MTDLPPVVRFAPSPNGDLHLGHALSALRNDEYARVHNGRFLLRIEDIDAARCRPEFESAIADDLAWLGLQWETPVRRQSEHMATYRKAIDTLERNGLLYRSFESRTDIARMVAEREVHAAWPRDPDGAPLFPGKRLPLLQEGRLLAQGLPFAWRIDMTAALARVGPLTWNEHGDDAAIGKGIVDARPQEWGDAVLARKDTPTSYHVAVVIDDALQGITDVIRGADLYHATSLHRLLQSLLGLPQPRYRHHALVRDAEGHKLSKSTRATSLRALRADGITPADIRRRLGAPAA